MRDTKEYLLILKELIDKKIVSDKELYKCLGQTGRSKSMVDNKIRNLKYMGFNILFKTFDGHRYFYIK